MGKHPYAKHLSQLISLTDLKKSVGNAGAKRIHEIYSAIPNSWKNILEYQQRIQSQPGDWILDKTEAQLSKPYRIHLVQNNILRKYEVITYFLSPEKQIINPHAVKDSLATTTISKALSVPAICYTTPQKPPAHSILTYIGNYNHPAIPTNRIFLSISSSKKIPFHLITTKGLYQAQTKLLTNPNPQLKWDAYFHIQLPWHNLFKYLQDKCLDRKSREILYKLYTYKTMVGTFASKLGHSNLCPWCQTVETIPHCYLECQLAQHLWGALYNYFHSHTQVQPLTPLKPWEQLFGYTPHMPESLSTIWKIYHARDNQSHLASPLWEAF